MAFKYREEIVGKRFLSVSTHGKLNLSNIESWDWRSGIVRAATHSEPKNSELAVLVEFDDVEWKRREWIRVYQEKAFKVFLVEHTLVWALRGTLSWPALNFKPLVDRVNLSEHKLKPIEYLVNRHRDFIDYAELKVYQDADCDNQPALREHHDVRRAVRKWTEFQDGQRILLTTPSVLVGYRVEVYRVEGTTQWYTAVIVSYNDSTRELTLTDDTVLEEHNEDPTLVHMNLIGDGVVESILKGENVGITPRRRTCNNQGQYSASRTRSLNVPAPLAGNNRLAVIPRKSSRAPAPVSRDCPASPPTQQENEKGHQQQQRRIYDEPQQSKSRDELKDQARTPASNDKVNGVTESAVSVIISTPPSCAPDEDRPVLVSERPATKRHQDVESVRAEAAKPTPHPPHQHEQQSGLVSAMHPAYPRVPGMPNQSRTPVPPSHMPPYGINSPHLIPHHVPAAGPQHVDSTYRQLLHHPVMQHQYDVLWQQKYPHPSQWMVAQQYQEMRIAQERDRRIEREKRDEQEKSEREKAEKERMEKEQQERERAQREVQQHFEESLRLASQKWSTGWSPISNLPLSKPSQNQPPKASAAAYVAAEERNSREKSEAEARERYFEQDRWMAMVQQRQEMSQANHNFQKAEPRVISNKVKTEAVAPSSGKPAVSASPVTAGSGGNAQTSFSLYGYQPFQHTYITHSQLKAQEDSRANVQAFHSKSSHSSTPPTLSYSQEKEVMDRSGTPSSRTSTPIGRPPSLSPKHHVKAEKGYEYFSSGPAPAHQNSGRVSTPQQQYPPMPLPNDQPQNLVKSEPKGRPHYISSKPVPVLPGGSQAVPTKTVPSTTYSYSLIQQGLVPNPLYAPAHATTTTAPTIVSQSPSSKAPSRVLSPSQVQPTYHTTKAGPGITTGTPVFRPSINSSGGAPNYGDKYSRTYSPVIAPPNTNPAMLVRPVAVDPSGRPHLSSTPSSRISPSPAHGGGAISPSSQQQQVAESVSRLPANAPLQSQAEAPPKNEQSAVVAVGPMPCIQTQPLNLQSTNALLPKRKPSRDNGVRKKQRTVEDLSMPPQLQPQAPIPSSASSASSSSSSVSSGQIAHRPHQQQHLPQEEMSGKAGCSNASQTTGFMDSFRSFVTSTQSSQYRRGADEYAFGKHAKAKNKIKSELLQSESERQNGGEDDSRTATASPAPSTCTTSSTTSSGTNHTKLKKAWLQRHSETEDKKNHNATADPTPSPLPTAVVKQEPTESVPVSVASENSNSSSSLATTNTTTGGKSGGRTARSNPGTPPAETKEEDVTTSSASETEQEVKSSTPGSNKRKTRGSRKRTSGAREGVGKRQKATANNNNADDNSASEQHSSKKEETSGSGNKRKSPAPSTTERESSRRRGRRPKGKGGGGATDDTHKKKTQKPFEKPSVALLKKTGDPFLQDGACCDVAPKLPKCRECRMTPHQRSKKQPNIFCRFYAFRKLRYGKNGTILSAGFSEPSDASDEDLKLWLPQVDSPPKDLDMETSKFLLAHVGDQFCDLVEQEREAQALHMGEDKTITWKRVVQGVREMCDVCETTLFNIHWVCHKCGFVVCIDCYKARKNGTAKEEELPPKDRDEYQWLLCNNRQPHEQDRLMLTQIIAGNALWDVGRVLHSKRSHWNIPAYCNCVGKDEPDVKRSGNGICKQLMSAVTKCFTDQNQVNGDTPRATRKNGLAGLIKQEEGLGSFSSESGGSPLSWLADVALNSSGKQSQSDEKCGSDPGEDDDEKNFSTLRELLIRPTGKGSSRKMLTSTLDEVISCVIEHKVGKSERKEEKELIHFTRRFPSSHRGREPLPIRICTIEESRLLYPDVPHSWLCNGKLLLLHDPQHDSNLRLFQEQWKRGQPVMVADVSKHLDMSLWHPDGFCRDFGDVKNDLVNCKTGNVLPNLPMRKFWEGFENFSKRMMDDEDGDYMLLKLKDWPPGEDFSELLPSRFRDLMKVLPLPNYTHRDGLLNLAGRLPECFVRPDLGPKMYNAYGSALYPTKGTTNLHLDISDAVNVMVYVGIPKDGKDEEHIQEALRAIDEGGSCDSLMRKRVREKGVKPGALWHIFNARDADKIRDLLNKVAIENGETLEPHHDPIHDQSWYLDAELRERLKKEYKVEGYAIAQCLGDAVFIPAGAPHQVRNLHSCIKVAEDFVSPENIAHCFTLTQEFRHLSDTHTNHEDKLQIKNIIYHTVRDAMAVMQATNDPSSDSK